LLINSLFIVKLLIKWLFNRQAVEEWDESKGLMLLTDFYHAFSELTI